MLSLGGSTKFAYNHSNLLLSSSSPLKSSCIYFHNTCKFSTFQFRPSLIKMSSTAVNISPPQIVEHFVLFKVRPDTDPSKVNALVNNLSGLTSLDGVLHLTVGPVFRNRSSSLTFTHMLHSRYATEKDLDYYSKHPAHIGVVTENVKPICEDIMAFDWVSSEVKGSVKFPPGSAFKVSFLKLKEDSGETEKNEVLGVIRGMKEKLPAIEQLSYGENISPARAKGFSIGSIALFNGIKELEAVDLETEVAKEEKDKVKDKLDGVVVLDYVVPPPQSASL